MCIENCEENWSIPKDRTTILKACRYIYNVNPYVNSIIDLAANAIEIDNEGFREEVSEIILSVLKIGEYIVIVDNDKRNIVAMEPELISIYRDINGSKIVYKIDENAFKDVTCTKDMLEKIRQLSIENFYHIFARVKPEDIRGYSVMCKYLPQLMSSEHENEFDCSKFKEDIKKELNEIIPQIQNYIKDVYGNVVNIKSTFVVE